MPRRLFHRVDVGRVRPRNEDYVFVDESLGLAIVADGVGGHRAGDRAARLAAEACAQALVNQRWAIESVRRGDKQVDREDLGRFVRHALKAASKQIYLEAQANPDCAGMSSTCTLFLDLGPFGLLAHVGDSRAYLVRDDEVALVTTDHVVATVAQGDEGPKRVKRRVLARAVGHAPDVEVDVSWVTLEPQDRLVLCSDGLSDLLASNAELPESLEAFGAQAAPEVLVDLANTRGGRDNISVVVVDVADAPQVPSTWPSLREQLHILRELPPFQRLSYLELELLRTSARVDNVAPAAIIAYPDEEPSMAVVIKGTVELNYGSGEALLVGPGGLLGETCLTQNGAWPYVALAREDVTLVAVPATVVRHLLETRPRASARVMWEFLSVMSARASDIGRNAAHRVHLAPEAW
ncbi:MAG: protein phosphatase 2C domain-containing protein [Myxococcaceae bacterium]|nr:protein phosphatase 2C domain-containing protein [Myxococcaceae bacterium]